MTQVWKNDAVVPVTVLRASLNDASRPLFEALQEGDVVRVSGTSKGKGFQGVVKRHGFHGGPKTHGQKNRLRAPGSIGPTAPQRVLKGRKMGGHMGVARITVRNLKIVEIRHDTQELLLRGAVPGNRGGMIEVKSSKFESS